MQIECPDQPGSAITRLSLLPNDAVTARAGTLLAMSRPLRVSNVDCLRPADTNTARPAKIIAGDRFICNRFECDGQPADLWLGHDFPGEARCLELSGQSLIVNPPVFVAATGAIVLTPYTPLATETWLKVGGSGNLILAAFGALSSITVEREYRLARNQVAAFSDTLEVDWPESRRRWRSRFFRRDNAWCCFRGRGKLWYQSHDPKRFGAGIGRRQPRPPSA